MSAPIPSEEKDPDPDRVRILITGGCGFIGSHFINHYFRANPACFIVNLDAMYYCAAKTNVAPEVRDSERYVFVKGNIASFDLVLHLLTTYAITHVVHFAAQSHVQNSFEDALQYTQDNVVGTHTLLEAARKYGNALGTGTLKKFIHISTDEVYGESMLGQDGAKKTESESVLCPTNPYAATKAAAELIAQSYYHSFKMPILITRGNNVYGPRQYPEKLIPRFIQLLGQNQKVQIQGDGSNVRGFLHVSDVCRALTLVLEKGEIGEIYNIGSDDGQEYSVLEIARILVERMKPGAAVEDWIEYVPDRPFNDKRYYISNDKVKALGWDIRVKGIEI